LKRKVEKESFNYIPDKVSKLVVGWVDLLIDLVVCVCSMLLTITKYTMEVFILPKSVCGEMNKIVKKLVGFIKMHEYSN